MTAVSHQVDNISVVATPGAAQKVTPVTSPSVPLGVYHSITKIQVEISRRGISKDNVNERQGFKFRGIDDVYNSLGPLFGKHGLCMLPTVLARTVTERSTKAGGVLFSCVLEVRYDLISSVDGSSHSITVLGEATDSGDKATNKAMTAAYKYACLQMFCVPTKAESKDADEETHPEVIHPISAAQRKSLGHLIHISGASPEGVCKFFKVGRLEEVPATRFCEVRDMLNKKIKRQNVEESEGT